MSGDGVSLQTSLVQLGKVARSQTQSQQSSAGAPNAAQELQKRETSPVEKVQETGKTDHQKIDPEERRERDDRRRERRRAGGDDPTADEPEAEAEPDAPPGLGGLIDTKA